MSVFYENRLSGFSCMFMMTYINVCYGTIYVFPIKVPGQYTFVQLSGVVWCALLTYAIQVFTLLVALKLMRVS